MREKTESQIIKRLDSMRKFGESRHKAKEEQRRAAVARGEKLRFGAPVQGIFSYETYFTYRKQALNFLEWCRSNKNIGKKADLQKLEKYAVEYLQDCERRGLSKYTVATRRAALSKLFCSEIKYTTITKGEKITRSRFPVENDKHFSERKNPDLVLLCKSTGGRRSDILKITPESFFIDDNGVMWCRFEQSKGGKDRIAPVLPENRAKQARI